MENLERTMLVAHIEHELEHMIARGGHPKTGGLPSERRLARNFGVARGTIREALLRLAARGLVVRRQGRQARAIPIENAVTLENLGVVLHDVAHTHSERLRLLEGYFTLKRETTVELLACSCKHAPDPGHQQVTNACLWLQDGTRRDDGTRRWVWQEFELLRVAAVAAERPGHYLLVQSLARAFWGMAEFLRPLLAPEAVHQWSNQALSCLLGRDEEELRRDLPPLLLACDEHVLGSLKRRINPSPPDES